MSFRVDGSRYVEYHIVVAAVAVVSVGVPVGRAVVYLDVSHPHGAANPHLGIEEVGTGIAVVEPRVDYFNAETVGCLESSKRENLVFPYVVEKLFHI